MSPDRVLVHEILTSLSILKMGLDNLELSCVRKMNKDEHEILRILKKNTEKLTGLINDLHDPSKIVPDQI